MPSKPTLPILNRSHPLAQGLVAAWLMNEQSGLKHHDLSGYGNHGTSTDENWLIGPTGPFRFNNSNGKYIEIPHNSILEPAEITIAANVYTTAFNLFRNYVEKGENTGYRARVNTNQTFSFFDRGATNNLASVSTAQANEWINLICTGDINGLRIYWNGELDNSNATAYGGPTPGGTLRLGEDHGGIADSGWTGGIDYVYIYNRAITAEEVRELYTDPYSLFRSYVPKSYLFQSVLFSTQLTWTDNSSDETLFSIERSTTSASAGFAEIATTGSNVATYNDQNLNSGAYWYRVRASNGAYSNYTNVAYLPTILAPSNLDVVVTQDA